MKLLRLIGLIFAMVGLIMFIVLGFVYSNERRFVASSRAAEGTVIDLVLDVSTTRRNGAIRRTNHVYKPLVAFRTASGQETAFLSSSGSNPPSYSVGDRVRVRYRPDFPERAKQGGVWNLWLGSAILSPFALVFSAIGAGLLIASARR